MAASIWKGYISFGLISAPVRLLVAARESHVRFHEVHRECGTRVHQQLYCPYDERVVSRDEIAMGYEVSDDKYVLVDRNELKKLQPSSSTAMEITQFVKLADVDPVYFQTSYFCLPEEAGKKAYALLLRAMESLQYAAIAKITLHQREQVTILRPYKDGLTLHTLYYPAEIREAKGYGKDSGQTLKKEELRLGEEFAKALLKPFHPQEFQDEYQQRVQELIESKSTGEQAPKPEKGRRLAPVLDLMSALKKSLAEPQDKGESKSKSRKLKRTA
ncbi:MAG TPA: Ku protein [Dongiaceae bacterium]|nr:Ku protein [Dongiaceae bacterium]